jgi:group I intron endonuclease
MRGIYTITNIITDTVYYGQSGNIERRLKKHFYNLKVNKHANPHLQSSWNKHGKDAFIFAPIQIMEDKNIDLTPIEKKYKDGAYSLGLKIFNIREPELKAPLSEETKQKISKNRKEKYKGKKSYWFGKHHTEETKNKISKSRIGNKWSVGNKSNTGRIFSKKTRKRMSEARRKRDK